VIQYNKRDLPNVYSCDELNAELNPGGKVPFFEAVAKDGKGVFETFRGISHLLMEKVTKDLRRNPTAPGARPAPEEPAAPAAAAPAAPPRLPGAAPAAPAAAQPVAAAGGLDYGREIDLSGEAPARPAAAARPEPVAPPPPPAARPAPPPPPRPEPVVTPQPVVAAPPREAPRPAPQPTPVQAHVASVLDTSVMPAPAIRTAPPQPAAPAASRANGAAEKKSSEEIMVPVSLPATGTHEIVLRIVLKIER